MASDGTVTPTMSLPSCKVLSESDTKLNTGAQLKLRYLCCGPLLLHYSTAFSCCRSQPEPADAPANSQSLGDRPSTSRTPAPPAAEAAAVALQKVKERLEQLRIQANCDVPRTVKQLLQYFWPGSTAAAAAAAAAGPTAAAVAAAKDSIQQALLQQDVRDKFGRNVLHLVATNKPEDIRLELLFVPYG